MTERLVLLVIGLVIAVGGLLFVEDKSRKFWPTVGMEAFVMTIGSLLIATALSGTTL